MSRTLGVLGSDQGTCPVDRPLEPLRIDLLGGHGQPVTMGSGLDGVADTRSAASGYYASLPGWC